MLKICNLSKPYGYASNCYLLLSGGEYAVVDPSVSVEYAESIIKDKIEKVKYIFITHAHFDHILEIKSWSELGGEVIVGECDGPALSDAVLNCYLGFLGVEDGYCGAYTPAKEGDTFTLGDCSVRVTETPGHTKGGVSYLVSDAVFVGDTVFENGGYGRCDLPGGDLMTLMHSISKILLMPDTVTLYSGHGGKTTVKETKKFFI